MAATDGILTDTVSMSHAWGVSPFDFHEVPVYGRRYSIRKT
jgi:hypothetical protein